MRTILETASAHNVWFLSENLLMNQDWRLEMMKTLDRPETLSKKIFKTFFKQHFKKSRCNISGDRFCNSITNRYSLSNTMLQHKLLLQLS